MSSSTQNTAEYAVSLAALILADESLNITPEKLQTILKAANIEDVEPIWTTLFAKALDGKDVKEMLTAVTTSAPDAGRPVQHAEANDEGGGDDGEIDLGAKDGGESDDSDAEGGMFDLFG